MTEEQKKQAATDRWMKAAHAIADGMEQEVKSYEEKLSAHHNVKITLA